MKQSGHGVRWMRRGVAAFLVLAAVLAASGTWAASDAWANETESPQQSSPAVNLHADRKTDVNGVTSYKLGNATVKGVKTSYLVVEVNSGSFTFVSSHSGRPKPSSALDGNGSFVPGENVVAGVEYKYLVLDSTGRDNASLTAKDAQAFLRGLTFHLDGDKEQTVSVSVTKAPPKTPYMARYPDQIARTTATTRTITVRYELRDVTSSNQATKVLSLTSYETTLTALYERGFDVESLDVSVGGRSLNRGTQDVSFNRTTGRLRLPATIVTGDVRIALGANWLVTIRDTWSSEPLTVVRASGFTPLNRDSLNEKIGTREGYTLVGYAHDGVEWNFADLVTGDMTLNPRWVLDAPVVTLTAVPPKLTSVGDKSTLAAQVTPPVPHATVSYQWFRDGAPIADATDAKHETDQWGAYTVKVTATDPQTGVSSTGTASTTVGSPDKHTVVVREKDGSVTYLKLDVFHGGMVDAGVLGGVSRRGHVLEGWVNADGTRFDPLADKITSDLVISPVWKPAKYVVPLAHTGLTVVAPVVAAVLLLVVAGVLVVLRLRRE